ncbi:MAG: hypothetical protein M1281_12840 [Chloroflexi bacterium]|nr:hypothetical protein [Chloroflexota bacterium]
MFYPQEMTGVQLIVPSRDVMAVTKVLVDQGIFHQRDGSFLSTEKELGSTGNWPEKANAYAGLERRIYNVMRQLSLEEEQLPEAKVSSALELDEARQAVDQVEQEVKQASDKLAAEQKRLEQLENSLKQLEPLAGIELPMGTLRNPHFLYSILGVIPNPNIDRLQTSLERIPFVFLRLRQDEKESVVWLAGMKRNADVLDRAARSAYLNPLVLPEVYQGTPSEIIAFLMIDIAHTQEHINELKATIDRLSKDRKDQLQSLLWTLRTSRMLADAVARFGQLQYTFLIVGWVPTARLEEFNTVLKQVSKYVIIETFPFKRGRTDLNVPVSLKNPRIMQPFEILVNTYARPRYEEIDPTFLLAITFPLLFGAMFGDVGQGLTLALFGALLASRKVRLLHGLASLGGLIIACGLSATLFGFLYGSLFGVETILPALWMRPMNNILLILGIAIGAGVFLLSVGFILGIINSWVAKDWGKFFFDPHGLSGLVLYWSLLGLAAGLFLVKLPFPPIIFGGIAVISGIIVMFSETLNRLVKGYKPLIVGGTGTFAIQTFFELFESLLSYLSNSLSYVRVGAFAVAHVGLSAVVFILAALVSSPAGPIYWVVVAAGNLFIIGFEGLIVGIQTMRLEYYEFFTKFFSGGGMRYEPLAVRPKMDK